MLRERQIDVVATAEDGPGLVRIVGGHKPDLAIIDVRLPPTFTDEGVRAAIAARQLVVDQTFRAYAYFVLWLALGFLVAGLFVRLYPTVRLFMGF